MHVPVLTDSCDKLNSPELEEMNQVLHKWLNVFFNYLISNIQDMELEERENQTLIFEINNVFWPLITNISQEIRLKVIHN